MTATVATIRTMNAIPATTLARSQPSPATAAPSSPPRSAAPTVFAARWRRVRLGRGSVMLARSARLDMSTKILQRGRGTIGLATEFPVLSRRGPDDRRPRPPAPGARLHRPRVRAAARRAGDGPRRARLAVALRAAVQGGVRREPVPAPAHAARRAGQGAAAGGRAVGDRGVLRGRVP